MRAGWLRISGIVVVASVALGSSSSAGNSRIRESTRELPLVYSVDVVVVGGSSGAVAAACEAARCGARVFLATSRPYLGDDLCATLRLWSDPQDQARCALAERLFAGANPLRPMHVKRTLDQALLDTDVRFLYGCYVTDVLRDDRGQIAGVVMANRAGRQAVAAKVIVDATECATVARLAGATVRSRSPGPHQFKRVVIGGEPRRSECMSVRPLDLDWFSDGRRHPAFEYSLALPTDGSFQSLAEIEQLARDATFHPGQLEASDTLFHVPPDRLTAESESTGDWPGPEQANIASFRPAGVKHVFLLGGCADLTRPAAEALLRPVNLMAVGVRIGRAAAEEAASRLQPQGVKLPGHAHHVVTPGDIREILTGVRPTQTGLPTIRCEARTIPVLGEYDVVVVGGGTSGAPAGIAAARDGARTLVIECLHSLGGVGTTGLIGKYWHGVREGFTRQVDEGVKELGATVHVVGKAEWWRHELRRSGAEIWSGALGCGVWVAGDRVRGVVVATPDGRGVVAAKVVIDATGNADIAAAAGAPCVYTGGSDISLQLAGMPPRNPGDSYINTCYTYADDTDMVDIWHLRVYAKDRFRAAYDLGQLVDTRERRGIVGDATLTPIDQHAARTYPDTISVHLSNYDMYGFPVHPLYLLKTPPKDDVFRCYLSYRCLLPRGLDGLLVIGIGLSAHPDAMAAVRMQADMQNLGYAAGVVAARAARKAGPLRSVDIKAVQKHLIEMGNLPAEVLTHKDSFSAPADKIREAVHGSLDDHTALAMILAHPEQSLPELRVAYARADNPVKLQYARILAVMGDGTGIVTLLEAVHSLSWDSGSNIAAFGNQGADYSRVDALIIALGYTRDTRALPAILEKARQLGPDQPLSHFRALAIAMESIGDPSATEPLAELLKKPGMMGHAITTLSEARRILGEEQQGKGRTAQSVNPAVREIVLARALYRCGDRQGLAESILRQYVQDLRGHFARHAQAVLSAGDPE